MKTARRVQENSLQDRGFKTTIAPSNTGWQYGYDTNGVKEVGDLWIVRVASGDADEQFRSLVYYCGQ